MNKGKASDEEIIFPDSEVVIQDEKVTVIEISYRQGMLIHARIQPMLDDMAKAMADENTDFSRMADVFATHADVIDELLILTTGKDENWLELLSDEDGQTLLMTFWMVNRGFFTRRLVMRSMQRLQNQKNNKTSDHASQSTTEKSSVN